MNGVPKEVFRFSVSSFNELVNSALEAIGDVIIEGEITQLNVSGKGGVNIVLKDPKQPAIINISGYAPRIEGLNLVKIGMQAAVWGIPQIYSPYGKFSVSIYKILPIGAGALQEAYEQLKQLLAKDGLFNEERKRPLPEYLTRIALVTAKNSAAQSDFLKILQEHNASFAVDFYPVPVQGKFAEDEIIHTLNFIAGQKNIYDCLVLIRGGGSLEDLITFNGERLARTIFAMPVPVLVGVGHERDESIADFVADVRASTPSQAAYYLTAINENFRRKLDMQAEMLKQMLLGKISGLQNTIDASHSGIGQKLLLHIAKINSEINQLTFAAGTFPQKLQTFLLAVNNSARLLQSYNPLNILQRGYSLIKDEQGRVITDVSGMHPQQKITLHLAKGHALAQLLKIFKNSP